MPATLGTDLLTIADTAERLQCAPLTVRRMIARGELKAVRFGRLIRIHPEDLNRALKPVTNIAVGGGRVG